MCLNGVYCANLRLLDANLPLLQNGNFIQRNIGGQFIFEAVDLDKLSVEFLFVLVQLAELIFPLLFVLFHAPLQSVALFALLGLYAYQLVGLEVP